jgi:hypothetical protein
MQGGHIVWVELLKPADDAGLIEQSKAAFERHPQKASYQDLRFGMARAASTGFPKSPRIRASSWLG